MIKQYRTKTGVYKYVHLTVRAIKNKDIFIFFLSTIRELSVSETALKPVIDKEGNITDVRIAYKAVDAIIDNWKLVCTVGTIVISLFSFLYYEYYNIKEQSNRNEQMLQRILDKQK